LGIGDWGLGPIPNPQSPIPQSPFFNKNKLLSKYLLNNMILKIKIIIKEENNGRN
jgi:hypothetical protein